MYKVQRSKATSNHQIVPLYQFCRVRDLLTTTPISSKSVNRISKFKWENTAQKLMRSKKDKRIGFSYRTAMEDRRKLRHFYAQNVSKPLPIMETRADVVLFRMRLLPTLRACQQLVAHTGVYVNNKLIKRPSKEMKVGDIISLPFKVWKPIMTFLEYNYSNRMRIQIVRNNPTIENKRLKVQKEVSFYTPSHLEIDYRTLRAQLIKQPHFVAYPFKVN